MMNLPRQQQGISLIVAIVVLVLLSLIATLLVRSVGSQQALNTQSLIGQRAFYAARAGLEWGTAQALQPAGSCAAGNTLLIEGVTVTVDCTPSDVTEAGVTYQVFLIDARAVSGVLGQPEFAQRRLTARLSNKP